MKSSIKRSPSTATTDGCGPEDGFNNAANSVLQKSLNPDLQKSPVGNFMEEYAKERARKRKELLEREERERQELVCQQDVQQV